uniref:Uncharacterized protein n=1 Tax=Picea glauca TaxID=3330 RepID=A0A124GML0_PICGL|nr:hypothetical protein ABT39_MTgene2114 [Picea glauca]QHR86922.1 hypothetical protein Q903MT_gene929 [Picea sitchensis]
MARLRAYRPCSLPETFDLYPCRLRSTFDLSCCPSLYPYDPSTRNLPFLLTFPLRTSSNLLPSSNLLLLMALMLVGMLLQLLPV